MIMIRHLRIVAFIVVIALCTQSALPNMHHVKKTAAITVFMHGSVFAFLSLLNVRDVTADVLHDNLLYVAMVKDIRANPLLEHDQLLFKLGPHHITPALIKQFWAGSLEDEHLKQAGNFIVSAYDSVNRLFQKDDVDCSYYTYGHLGLLSREYRASVAEQMYHWLIDLYAQYKKNYEVVRINLVGHSHGGGILLDLARCEELHGKGLSIENLVLYGAPIQVETAECAYMPLFQRVLNCYGDIDIVQIADWVSTSHWRSYSRFEDKGLAIERPEKHNVYDIRMLVNNNRFRINHANMWLMGRSVVACTHCDPLPFMILTPALINLVEQCSDHRHLDYNVIDTASRCVATVTPHKNKKVLASSKNLAFMLRALQKIAKNHWKPDDKSRNAVANQKTYRVLKTALKKIRALSKQPKRVEKKKA